MWTSIALVAALAVGAPEVTAETVEGDLITGRVKDISSKTLTVETEDGAIVIQVDGLLNVARREMPARLSENTPVVVELRDGSKLTASTFTAERGEVRLGLKQGNADSNISIAAKDLRTVNFAGAMDGPKKWPANGAADLLAIRKKDSIDFLEGVVGDVTEEHVEFSVDGEKIPVKRSRVAGIQFFQKPGQAAASPICVVETVRGWKLQTKSIALKDGDVSVVTLTGNKVSAPLDEITRFDFTAGKIAYLSDLEPDSVEWTPLIDFGMAAASLAEYYAPRKDQSREQRPITIDGKQYSKGLALYSRTAMTYRLPAGATRFKAVAGIDDAVGQGGHVRLQISADDKKLFDAAIAGKDGPTNIDLDVAGARRLSILVDYGDDQDAADHLDLADARIVK